jgi:hypothetical protein
MAFMERALSLIAALLALLAANVPLSERASAAPLRVARSRPLSRTRCRFCLMHDASSGAMPHLGEKRSYGCMRVDRRKMPEMFRLVREHRFDTLVHIFHQDS